MTTNALDFDEHKTIDQLKKENLSLKRENQAAMLTINKLLKDLSQKTEEINHLQSLVSQTVPVIVATDPKTVHITPEEEIAELQLERLRQAAKNRVLTLEETRMYDLLVKNLRLSKDKSLPHQSKDPIRDVSEIELVRIAEKAYSFDESSKSKK